MKRAKRLIIKLEAQLSAQSKEIAEYRKNEKDLTMLKELIIQGPKKGPTLASNRRRTWAPTSNTISPLGSISEEKEVSEQEKKPICQMMFGDLGRLVECTDEEWGTLLNDTLGKQIMDFDENEFEIAPPTFKFPTLKPSKPKEIEQITDNTLNLTTRSPNQPHARKSLLKTPKSFKHVLNRNNGKPNRFLFSSQKLFDYYCSSDKFKHCLRFNPDSPVSSSVASPIALDKDIRIRMLEQEFEELRHFQQTESMLHSSNIDS